MKINNLVKIAYKNIKSNKLRSALTMLGLIVGISSVIILVGIAEGSTTSVINEVSSLGSDILSLNITSSDYSIKYEDVSKLSKTDNISNTSSYKNVSATVSRNNETSTKTSIIATDNNYIDISSLKLKKGRNISIIDIENKSKVCILGSSASEEYFNLSNPINETIKINNDNYTVIGVLEENGSSFGSNVDDSILVPITTIKYLNTDTKVNSILLKVEDTSDIDRSILNVENSVRNEFQISTDYFTVTSSNSILESMDNINNTLTLLLGGIASISLIVGGIGVMNVMLVSVSERTKEIGIRKSLGAKRKDIMYQFLIESLMLCITGGLFGIIFGILIGYILTIFNISFVLSTTIIILSVTISLFIGLIFGIFPAYKASSLNPIDALRSE
ncbi:MAG: ABC transporter permease [Bacilli bacterium]